MTMASLLAYDYVMMCERGKSRRSDWVFCLKKENHLLDQFSAYYTITVVAMHLFIQWKAHHNQIKSQEFAVSKA